MFFIGTSGWVYPHWLSIFYPKELAEKEWLNFYSQSFNTVEVNTTFYRLIKPEVFLNWQEKTPQNFVFSLKANKFITHTKRLKDCQQAVKNFFESTASFKNNPKTVILFQLAPNFKIDILRLREFIKLLPKNWRFAFEFRHESWLNKETDQLLKEKNIALVIQDSPYWPSGEVISADFTYLRFHGKNAIYASNYSDRELENWAKKMLKWNKQGIDVYAYFNNDAMGYAVKNAKTLVEMLGCKNPIARNPVSPKTG